MINFNINNILPSNQTNIKDIDMYYPVQETCVLTSLDYISQINKFYNESSIELFNNLLLETSIIDINKNINIFINKIISLIDSYLYKLKYFSNYLYQLDTVNHNNTILKYINMDNIPRDIVLYSSFPLYKFNLNSSIPIIDLSDITNDFEISCSTMNEFKSILVDKIKNNDNKYIMDIIRGKTINSTPITADTYPSQLYNKFRLNTESYEINYDYINDAYDFIKNIEPNIIKLTENMFSSSRMEYINFKNTISKLISVSSNKIIFNKKTLLGDTTEVIPLLLNLLKIKFYQLIQAQQIHLLAISTKLDTISDKIEQNIKILTPDFNNNRYMSNINIKEDD